jgi:hypothetical protein
MNQLARWNAPAKYSGSNPVAQYSKAVPNSRRSALRDLMKRVGLPQ